MSYFVQGDVASAVGILNGVCLGQQGWHIPLQHTRRDGAVECDFVVDDVGMHMLSACVSLSHSVGAPDGVADSLSHNERVALLDQLFNVTHHNRFRLGLPVQSWKPLEYKVGGSFWAVMAGVVLSRPSTWPTQHHLTRLHAL